MRYSIQCDSCKSHHFVEVAANYALDQGIQWACPWCKVAMNRSLAVLQNARTSAQQKEFAALVFTAAFTIGIVLLGKKLSERFK